MTNSRGLNTKRNIVSGVVRQVINIILPFITRTIILYVLGAEYQGLSGLFTSILQILNLADLGFSSAVMFLLFKPLAEDDTETVCSIVAYLKKVYLIVGLVILVAGLVTLPLLPYLIVGSIPKDINIYVLFFIYLTDSCLSYILFGYKSALLSAAQREDVVSNIYSIIAVLVKSYQIIVLLLLKNYYAFIIVSVVGTIFSNIFIQIFSKKLYPQYIPKGKISLELKKTVSKQIKAIFIGKISDVSRNSFDSIVISSFLGLTFVAIYDNYYYIYTALYGVMIVINHAMQASIGNSLVQESVEKNYKDFMNITFLMMWIVGFCSICMLCLYQPFMIIWMKGNEEMLLPFYDMILFCIYFFAINMNNTKNLYLEGNGYYWECRFFYVFEAVANLVLNLILGYFFGITGILIATIATIFIFNFLCRTPVLFKLYFKCSKRQFYGANSFYFCITCVNACITYFICALIPFKGILELFLKALICLFIINIIYIICYFWTKQFKESMGFAKRVLGGRFLKKKKE